MRIPPYSQIQRCLSPDLLTGLPALNLVILRNIVLDPIVPYLRYLAYQVGFNAICRFGDYDNVVQEAVGGAPEFLNAGTDGVLVFLRLETLSGDLARNYAGLTAEQTRAEVDRVKGLIADVLDGIRRQTAAMILWHGLELPLYPALGILDGQRRDGQTATIQELNAFIRDALQRQRGAYWVDVNQCLARIGAAKFYDARYWQVAKAPYTLDALQEIASEIMKYFRALKGKAKKCLVLDCDGVLWGGTVGEDGIAGIKLGTTFPGSSYHELQQEALSLYHRGVVLALCSKNNPEDVWEVFEQHPDMVLRRHHIAAARINWRDKPANLEEIGHELSLGLDSLVLVENSEFEVGLVRRCLPQVTTIRLPPGKASEYRTVLASCGLFDTLALSEEDRARGAAYQADAARRRLRAATGDVPGFLRSLGMVLEIRFADEFALPRIAQLTQKTNQFNLTTRRYSEEDLRRLAEREEADVIYLRYRDRFGDAGIVGACVLRYQGEQGSIDSFLLSCRILGRAVEHAFLAQCLTRARARGASIGIAEYRPTAKNGQVKDFYPVSGFAPVNEDQDGGQRYRIDLTSTNLVVPDYFHIDSDIDAAPGQARATGGQASTGPSPSNRSAPGG